MPTTPRQILKNSTFNEELRTNGYVVLDFFDSALLEDAFKIISTKNNDGKFSTNNNNNIDVSFHCTFLDPDKSYKQLVWKVLNDLIVPFLEESIIDYNEKNIISRNNSYSRVCRLY